MINTCQLCGEEKEIDNHHVDYDKNITLKICRQCHLKIHSLKNQILTPLENPITIKCHKCNHEWTYKGRNPYYVTCPQCYNKININVVKGGTNDGTRN